MRIMTAAAAVLLLVGCSSNTEPQVDQAKLEAFHADLESDTIADLHTVIVDYRGERIFERYYEAPDEDWEVGDVGVVMHNANRLHDLRSVSKSVNALLVGLALGDEWKDDINRTIGDYFADRADEIGEGFADVTLEQLLTMQAGIEWNEMTEPYADEEGNYTDRNDEVKFGRSEDPIGLILARNVVTEPGTDWYYNGGLSYLLAVVVEKESGQPFDDFARKRLFTPLGITNYAWHRADAWPENLPPATASGLRLTGSDMAKLGALVLSDGQWQNEQLLPVGWTEAMTARHVDTVPWLDEPGMSGGYGYQWYRADIDGHDAILTLGNGDQRHVLFPDLDLAITIQAGRYNDFTQPTELLVARPILDAIGATGG
ncbi:6-aminohexanoate-oligomer exohydrolase [Altererythrobacter insulae]|nr:6-aminohexanoate-oligomer exohydrolase [Altererythrobacter insulae]